MSRRSPSTLGLSMPSITTTCPNGRRTPSTPSRNLSFRKFSPWWTSHWNGSDRRSRGDLRAATHDARGGPPVVEDVPGRGDRVRKGPPRLLDLYRQSRAQVVRAPGECQLVACRKNCSALVGVTSG